MNKKRQKHIPYDEWLQEELQDPKLALAYLNAALMDADNKVFLKALRDVLSAQGEDISVLAKDAHISRQSLYRMLSEKGNPRWENLTSLFDVLGYQMRLAKKS